MGERNQVFFLRKVGKIEFILFAFSFAGLILNVLSIKGGKLVMGLGLNAFALLYLFIATTFNFRKMAYKSQFDRVISTFAYISLAILVIGIMFTILKVAGSHLVIHAGLITVLLLMVMIQIRKVKIGMMSHDTTSLLYRLMIFWVVGLVTFYLLPGGFFNR